MPVVKLQRCLGRWRDVKKTHLCGRMMFVKCYRCAPGSTLPLPGTLRIQTAERETCCWSGIARVELEDNDIISLICGLKSQDPGIQ